MEALQVIRDLIRSLGDEERQTIRIYLTCFYQKGKEARSITLYDILVAEQKKGKQIEVASPAELVSTIYGRSSPGNFSRLLYRLREKILEGLIIDVNVERKGAYGERTRINIEVRKNLTQIQILRSRGVKSIAELLLTKVIDQCKRYELYEEILIALRLQIDFYAEEYGDAFVKNIQEQYKKYNLAKDAVLKAEIYRGQIHANVDFRTGVEMDVEVLRNMLTELSNDYKKTSSTQVGFYYFYILTQYYQLKGEYRSARKALMDNLKLLDLNPGIFTRIRVGNIKINLADNDLYLREFSRAFKTAQSATRYFADSSFNYTQAVEQMFYAQFYLGDYKYAREILLELLPDIDETTGLQYRVGKRIYLFACTSFMLQDFETSYKLTNRVINPIEDDKEGWNIGVRILTILSLIELQQFDEATSKIDALKNFLDTLKKENVSPRFRAALSIFRKLSNTGFDFKTFYQKEKARLEEFQQFEWIPKYPDIISVSHWIHAKVFKTRFMQLVPPAKKQNKTFTNKSEIKRQEMKE